MPIGQIASMVSVSSDGRQHETGLEANMASNLTFDQFAEVFAKALDEQNGGRVRDLSPASCVCREGGIAGDDFPELLDRLAAIYGTDFSGIPPFGGDEGGLDPISLFMALRRMLRGENEPDVTVGELYEAVKAGSWKSAFPDKCDFSAETTNSP